MRAGRTLVVTNDFPPRTGGIESFVAALTAGLPPAEVVVYASSTPGAARVDASLPFPVHRDAARTLLPTPRVRRRAVDLLHTEGCDAVLFGAAAPLGLLAGDLRAAGARRAVGLTHGHELWWARVPGTRQVLRRIGNDTDALTYLGEYTRRALAGALDASAAGRLVHLPPGVDTDRFRPGAGGESARDELGVEPGRPLVLCVGRLTPRKGQDALIRAFPAVLRAAPDAVLVLVGKGPDRARLDRMIDEAGLRGAVRVAGAVPAARLPAYYAAATVFAMPCRNRRLGLEVEGLGLVFLEAAASGLPVVVGRSGGAPEACRDGETGYVVEGTDLPALAARLSTLLLDRELAATMGRRGRRWVQRSWSWQRSVAVLQGLLGRDPPTGPGSGGQE